MESIPVYRYLKKPRSGNRASEWSSIDEAMQHLNIQKAVSGQITQGSSAYTFVDDDDQLEKFSRITGECDYIGREGIEFYPQELLIFKYDGEGPRTGTSFLRNVQVTKSKYRIPSQRVLLENYYLFPLVKGRGIEYFRYSNEELIVPFPYDKQNPKRPLDKNELRDKSPLLLAYYEKYIEVIKKQTKYSDKIRGPNSGEYYGLARTGPYSFQNVYVAFRDNTKWRATVVKSKVMPWGETKRVVFQNHAVSICERKDGSGYITEDEAYYITSILNTKIVENYIYASSDSRSFKIRPPIFIPKYDEEEESHKFLSDLSRRVSSHYDEIDQIRARIENIYIAMCSNN